MTTTRDARNTGSLGIYTTPLVPTKMAPGDPQWLGGVASLIQAGVSNGTIGDHAATASVLRRFPDAAKTFFSKLQRALADDDGSAAAYTIPIAGAGKGAAAYVVRWTSEDQQLDRFWVFDVKGNGVKLGYTDKGSMLDWVAFRNEILDGPMTPAAS